MSDSQRQAQAKQCVKQIILACKKEGRVTLDKVIQNTRQPEPYRLPSKRTVDEVVKSLYTELVSHKYCTAAEAVSQG